MRDIDNVFIPADVRDEWVDLAEKEREQRKLDAALKQVNRESALLRKIRDDLAKSNAVSARKIADKIVLGQELDSFEAVFVAENDRLIRRMVREGI